MSNLLKKDKGFTLIEIVLVLAIAGLILLIVFLAVSGAQKSRRDSQRKNDAGRILAQAEQYAANNNGTYPNSAANVTTFVGTYLNTGSWNDPTTGGVYTVSYSAAVPTVGNVSVHDSETCTNGAMVAAAGSTRVFAVEVFQENGTSYCVDNH